MEQLNKRESLLVKETIISIMELIGEMKDSQLIDFINNCRELNEKTSFVRNGNKTCQGDEPKI